MKHRLFIYILAMVCGVILLPSCAPAISTYGEINIASIETDIREDISGRNTFLLVVPNQEECQLVGLDSRLDQLRNQAATQIEYNHYQDDQFKGYQITYRFDHPDQIRKQIEEIKSIVVESAINELPTPEPIPVEVGSENTPVPDSYYEDVPIQPETIGVYYNPEQLSIQIAKPSETLSGKEWNVLVTINPLLMTGWVSEEFRGQQLEEVCRLSRFTYKLQVPGVIRSSLVENEKKPELVNYSEVTKKGRNSIEWTIETRDVAKLLEQDLDQFLQAELDTLSDTEQEEKWEDDEFQETYLDYLDGSVYTLRVKAKPPSPLFQVLTNVVAPIVALIGAALGVTAGIVKLKKMFKQRKENSDTT